VDVESTVLLVLATVVVIVVIHRISERTGLPAAALKTLVGIGYAFIPGPHMVLDPRLILTVVIPPLLYSAALDSSLVAIRRNLRTVISLSVLLVLVSALAVGVSFELLVPGATLAVGVALGAAIAPPDPVAALAVGRRVGLPPRLLTLIQGEGLLNDATALTLLSVAVAAATSGSFSPGTAALQFVLASVGGVAVGLLVATAVRGIRRLWQDPLTLNAVSLVTPFGAYFLGAALHVSGVLVVVVAGLVIGHDTPRRVSGASRLQIDAVWRLVNFLLEGFVFLLIGLQLPAVVAGLRNYDTSTVVLASVVTVGVVLLVRPLWLVLTQLLPQSLHTRLVRADGDTADRPEGSRARAVERLSGRELVVLSWAGTRGVISLAAISTLPMTTESGAPFPLRDLLLFCTYLVVLITLVGQGLTFAPLVRALGLHANAADQARLQNRARAEAAQAGLEQLDEMEREDHDPVDRQMFNALRHQLESRLRSYRQRLDVLANSSDGVPFNPHYEAGVRAQRAVLDAERERLVHLRDVGQLPDSGLRVLEREIDHQEGLLPTPARQ
jgi:CPA1 family monovalent cation:H+ antiporter